MTKITHVPTPTPEINRLRAAAALIPIIEAGLIDSKISTTRASLMASFCEWATEKISDDPYSVELALLDRDTCSTLPVDSIPDHAILDDSSGKPTFIGHYWLDGTPAVLSAGTACVDYSIAKGGKLVAYRWDGEPALDDSCFRRVGQ